MCLLECSATWHVFRSVGSFVIVLCRFACRHCAETSSLDGRMFFPRFICRLCFYSPPLPTNRAHLPDDAVIAADHKSIRAELLYAERSSLGRFCFPVFVVFACISPPLLRGCDWMPIGCHCATSIFVLFHHVLEAWITNFEVHIYI